jgi:hypothetical protein
LLIGACGRSPLDSSLETVEIVGISVSPNLTTILPSASQLYTARGITPSGSLVSTSVIWSADAGNIDGQGRFTAPSDEGE